MPITATIRRNRIPALIGQIPVRTRAAVLQSADNIRGMASVLAPRDTGSLVESLYISSTEDSDYGQRAAAAASRNPDAEIVPEVTPEFAVTLSGNNRGFMAVVGSAVEHGVFQEFGTRFIGPRAFLTPAVENEREAFFSQMSHVADA